MGIDCENFNSNPSHQWQGTEGWRNVVCLEQEEGVKWVTMEDLAKLL